jgi:hypothetical protein
LRVTTGHDDLGFWASGVDFANGIPRLRVSGSSYSAGVKHDDFGRIGRSSGAVTAVEELPLDSSAVSLGSTATELLDEKRRHPNQFTE